MRKLTSHSFFSSLLFSICDHGWAVLIHLRGMGVSSQNVPGKFWITAISILRRMPKNGNPVFTCVLNGHDPSFHTPLEPKLSGAANEPWSGPLSLISYIGLSKRCSLWMLTTCTLRKVVYSPAMYQGLRESDCDEGSPVILYNDSDQPNGHFSLWMMKLRGSRPIWSGLAQHIH